MTRFRRVITIVTLCFVLAGGVMIAGQRTADVALRAAVETETVRGDVADAIEQYKRVVGTYGKTDREIAVRALLRLAEAYQKLGDEAHAKNAYEQLIRDYPNHKDAVVLARARLGGGRPAGMTSRRVATVAVGGVGFGGVSPDGRYFPYTNWDDGDLYLRDLVTGTNRRVTNVSGLNSKPSQFAAQAAFSRDGRHVAYAWLNGTAAEVRIADLSGTAARPRRVFTNEDVTRISPDDWSADGKWLAVQLRRQDKTAQIGLIAVQDGALRVLKTVDWRGATRLMFSPDGKFLAYDLPVSDTSRQRDVFILAVDGSREVPAIVHPGNDTVMGWSADGSRLLFASDRSGTRGLWQVAVVDGRPQGTPDLIKSSVVGVPLGVTSNGALYSLVHQPRFNAAVSSNVHVTAFDFKAGRFLSAPVSLVQSFVGTNNHPSWSPDGKFLSYVSRREESESSYVIALRSVATGEVRELQPALNLYPPVARWSADGASFLATGNDTKGRQGLYRIDARTAAVSTIAINDDAAIRLVSESPDGKRLYYFRGFREEGGTQTGLIERDLVTGNERTVIRGQNIVPALQFMASELSPDGRWIVVRRQGTGAGSSALLLVSSRDDHPEPTELIKIDGPGVVGIHGWAPDSQAILVKTSFPDKPAELWSVSLTRGDRRKLDLKVDDMGAFSVHPDGRQVAYALTEPAKDDEVWVLENFLPARSASKPKVAK